MVNLTLMQLDLQDMAKSKKVGHKVTHNSKFMT